MFVKSTRFKQVCQLLLSLIVAKRDSAAIVLVFKANAFRYWLAITYNPVVAQPIRTQHG